MKDEGTHTTCALQHQIHVSNSNFWNCTPNYGFKPTPSKLRTFLSCSPPQGLAALQQAGRHHEAKGRFSYLPRSGKPIRAEEGESSPETSSSSSSNLFLPNKLHSWKNVNASLASLCLSDEWNSSEAAIEKFSKKFNGVAAAEAASTCGGRKWRSQ